MPRFQQKLRPADAKCCLITVVNKEVTDITMNAAGINFKFTKF